MKEKELDPLIAGWMATAVDGIGIMLLGLLPLTGAFDAMAHRYFWAAIVFAFWITAAAITFSRNFHLRKLIRNQHALILLLHTSVKS